MSHERSNPYPREPSPEELAEARRRSPETARLVGQRALDDPTRELSPEAKRELGRLAIGPAARGLSPEAQRELGRLAIESDRYEPTPDRHLAREAGEQTRERGVFRGERER